MIALPSNSPCGHSARIAREHLHPVYDAGRRPRVLVSHRHTPNCYRIISHAFANFAIKFGKLIKLLILCLEKKQRYARYAVDSLGCRKGHWHPRTQWRARLPNAWVPKDSQVMWRQDTSAPAALVHLGAALQMIGVCLCSGRLWHPAQKSKV